MADLKVSFVLSEQDLSHLRRTLRRASEAAKGKTEAEIVAGARELARRAREAKPPRYVLDHVDHLETIVAMLEDRDWALPSPLRARVLTALAYFSNPADLISDATPGLGFLDDAIMIEILEQDLRHEIKAYRDFQGYRATAVQRPWSEAGQAHLHQLLAERRKTLRAKAAEAHEKAAARSGRRFHLW
jgi:uncharacterized membrane protein YkvA (DUF1232 family)